MNIDIKVNSDKLIQEVSRLIKFYNREQFTVWGNFDNQITTKCFNEVRSVMKSDLLIILKIMPCWSYVGLMTDV